MRVVASTTHDVHRDLDSGRIDPLLREVFKNRLSVPALAERRADLAVMVDYFVRQQAKQIGRVVDGVSPESMRRLEAYSWPGNIRELRTVVERAVLVSRSTVLEIDQESLDERVTVGSYRLITRLGAGGMGEVWLARHKLLRRPAALKLIRPDVRSGAEHEQLVRRFEREAQVTSALRSPHTVQLYDFGVNDTGGFYYVMELLHGLDLEQIVSRFGAQPAERVIMLLRQACRSLAEAHDHGIIHRDIKPANLFVSRLGYEYDYLKVLDFGIVKGTAGDGQTALSAPGILQGTPAYMAPELINGEGELDRRADLYALGCAAYTALTAQLVFGSKTPAQMLLHHLQTTPLPPSHRSPSSIPAELDAVIMACLEKHPANRPTSAPELEARLAQVPCEPAWTQERARAWWDDHVQDHQLAPSVIS